MATRQEWRNSGLWERGALPPEEVFSTFLEAANGNFKSQWKNPPCVFPNDPPMDWKREMFPWLCEVTGGYLNTDVLRLMPFLGVHFSRTAYAEDLLAYCKAGYLHLEVIEKEEKLCLKRIPLDSLYRKHWRCP